MAPITFPSPSPFSFSSSLSSSSPSTTQASHAIKRATTYLADLSHRSLHAISTHILTLARRQQIVAIPTTYAGETGAPNPGTVAGIVLGSVAAVLLVLWLLYTCFNIGGAPKRSEVVEETVNVRRRRSRSPRRRSVSRSEVIEVRSPPRRERSNRRETVVIEERREVPPPRRDRDEDDIVEVIEEDDTPPPSRRVSERRSTRVSSGYRTVDPGEFAGGSRPVRKVRR